MADNFDLRKFLTENKLTKNAKLIKEELNSNVEDIAGAFHEVGLTGTVTLLFHSEHGMGEPEIEVLSAEQALQLILREAGNAEDVIVAQGDEIDQQGEYEEQTAGLECKLEVAILDHGTYEVYQGANGVDEASRSMKNKMNEEDNYKYFDEEGIGGYYLSTVEGTKIYSLEDSSVRDNCGYALEDPDGDIEFISIDVSGEPVSSEDIQNEYELLSYVADFIADDINAELGDDLDEGTTNEGRFSDSYDSAAAKQVGIQLQSAIGSVNTRAEIDPTITSLIAAAEEETGTTVTPHEKRVLSSQGYHIYTSNAEMEREGVEPGGYDPDNEEWEDDEPYTGKYVSKRDVEEGVKEKQTVKENKMTARDKYLTRLVENALGLEVTEDYQEEGYGDDNVVTKVEKRGEELPEQPTYSEGEEMVEEKPLPKYENIEKLMQEIEKSTDEAAHKYKMEEMRRVADGLEKKCTALEEGEDADHIDQKKLKQMKKDVMSLRKGIEKMEKVAEKKFAKKETKAELKEGFDLRNFLIENKLTSNSKLIQD